MEFAEIESLYTGLRVADVRDGMDWIGLFSKGSVARSIRPLIPGSATFGPALTVRGRGSQVQPETMTPEEYTEWARNYWYKKMHIEPYAEEITPGDVLVFESPDLGVGQLGSNNTLKFRTHGANGAVTSGGCRDIDEVRLQGFPVFAQYINQTMTQGRLEYDSHNIPVTVGNVLVRPGDIVVADGDGVIVVPQQHATEVATYARQELEHDKDARRKMYAELGWEPDRSVL
ncbi:Regulator of RNase E activity RraA [Microlunatus soli]|uniref:Putative 4-hydroxy-4-methyl-2-oxoglutarate aldolase n=2 Tax=Microlunatus soli TaxID=630515 RepID=A0A1H1ZQ92_9ACTN|nr:Regulator of RNase E activity RraA [Microlunatus soli]